MILSCGTLEILGEKCILVYILDLAKCAYAGSFAMRIIRPTFIQLFISGILMARGSNFASLAYLRNSLTNYRQTYDVKCIKSLLTSVFDDCINNYLCFQ